MPSSQIAPSAKPPSGQCLSFVEREEIALLYARGHGMREIARRLERAPSTLSRELRRNAATRGGGVEYRATNMRIGPPGIERQLSQPVGDVHDTLRRNPHNGGWNNFKATEPGGHDLPGLLLSARDL
jgi:hypothetical protein